jgi:glutamyl endopeptidase
MDAASSQTPQATRSIIGPDERQEAPFTPWRNSICCLEYEDSAIGWVPYGTGWLIAKDKVVTAAHCLEYPSEHPKAGTRLSRIRVSPGRSGETGFPIPWQISEKFSKPDGYTSASGESPFDYAVIHLPKPCKGLQTFLELAEVDRPDPWIGQEVCVSGYPVDSSQRYWRQFHHTSLITAIQGGLLSYSVDTTEGQSGAPVFLPGPGAPQVIAIHTRSASGQNGNGEGAANSGTAMTLPVRAAILGWAALRPYPRLWRW